MVNVSNAISSISLKKDKLVVAENGSSVYVYDITESGNNLVQTITLNDTNWIKTHLDYDDRDGDYHLTIWSPFDSYVLMYMSKESNNQFSLCHALDFNGTQINYASVSAKF